MQETSGLDFLILRHTVGDTCIIKCDMALVMIGNPQSIFFTKEWEQFQSGGNMAKAFLL